MLRSSLVLVATMATTLAMVGAGCGDDTTSTKPPAPEVKEGIQPAPASAGAAACSGAGTVQAINKLFLGDTNRDGSPNPTSGWKQYGYDLDKMVSTKTSTGLCEPRAGGSKAAIYPDGDDGRDNSFGKNILPIILGLSADLSTTANESITNGEFTIMLDMASTGKECSGATAKLYVGAQYQDAMGMDAKPKWDGTDEWPLAPELLNNPADPGSAKISFADAYFAPDAAGKNTWVSGTDGTVKLQLSISGFTVSLDIVNAVITHELADDGSGATNGTIAGILETEQLVSEISKVASAFDASFCDPMSPTLQSILNQLRQASDIMKDGSQKAGVECDGISIGLGFTTKAVKLGKVAEAAGPGEDPCAASGGAGGAGGGAGGAGGGAGGAGGAGGG